MIVPAELTAMPQSYVIAAGLRANPDAAEERTELETLCWLNVLRYNMAVGRVSGFIKIGRSYRQAFETTVNAPGVTEDECRRMAEMSEQVDVLAKAEPILGALCEADFVRQAEAFRAVPALASSEDADFSKLDAAFGPEEEFADAIADYVARTPALAAWAMRVRAELDDDERLDWLVAQLAAMSDEDRVGLPESLKTIHAISYFAGQIVNGGIHQAFFNASGDLAPEVAAGLCSLGLTAQAKIVENGMSMFSVPYPCETGLRRDSSFHGRGDEWNNRLAGLGAHMDLDAIRPALIQLARREGVLPG